MKIHIWYQRDKAKSVDALLQKKNNDDTLVEGEITIKGTLYINQYDP